MDDSNQVVPIESLAGQVLPPAGSPPPIEDRLTALEARAFRHGWQMDRLAGRIHDITEQVKDVHDQVKGARAEIADFRQEMNERFAQLNARLDSVTLLAQQVVDRLDAQMPAAGSSGTGQYQQAGAASGVSS